MSDKKQGAQAPKRRHPFSHQRELVLLRADEIGSVRRAAEEAGFSYSAVLAWRRRFRKEGYYGLLRRLPSERVAREKAEVQL